LLAFVVLGSLACSEIAPTGVDEGVLPEEPITVEVRLPWDEFASNLAVFGGFGSTDDLGLGIVSHAFGDSLEAHTLVRLLTVPKSASVRDTAGTQRTDTLLQVLGGRIIAVVDSVGTVADGPVSLQVGMFRQAWDATTATWDLAVDSTGNETAWEEPGAGPVGDVLTTEWDAAVGDSAVFELDSAQVAAWSDALADTTRRQGLRLAALTEGVRLEVTNVLMQVDTKPSLNPDTTVVLVVNRQQMTFVYTPSAPPPDDEIRVGGTPSWRAVLDLDIPQTLSEPAELCARVTCPIALTAGRLNYAAIVLRTRRTAPSFAPSDTVNIDARPVFDRSTLPKTPLGNSLFTTSVGKRLGPEIFTDQTETEVEIPITAFMRTLLTPDSTAALPPPHTLALLSTFEPVSIAFASFYGPATLQAPVLKLVITAGPSVELP
jgi:hypothetical protein